MEQQRINQLKTELSQFTGSETFYRNPLFPGCVYTDGIKHLAEEAEAYWLLDHIFANQMLAVLKDQPFQVWKITVNEDQTARISVEDGNDHELTFFHLGYTDFPLDEMTVWMVDNTLLLPSEY